MAKTTVARQASYSFSQVAEANISRSRFERSSGLKTTFNSGLLIPVFVDTVEPGDTHSMQATSLVRLATPLHPIMDNIYVDYHFFFVPNRLLWNNWQRFMGERKNPNDSIDYTIPQMTAPTGGYKVQTIQDYFRLPVNIAGYKHQSLPLRAYNLIWNEWYRDENLQDSVPVRTGDNDDLQTDYKLLRRGKRHDYFTSCLPWPQKGSPVTIKVGDKAPVYGVAGVPMRLINTGPVPSAISNVYADTSTDALKVWNGTIDVGPTNPVGFATKTHNGENSLYADIGSVSGISINALREAVAMQQFLERDARGGTRYTELLRSHFGVTSSDSRLQRPEYLGGGSHPISVQPVPQTSSSDTSSPQGNLGAFGMGGADAIGFTKSFEEHGIIIGLASVRADMTYQDGLDRFWSRQTRYDFMFPEFANLGEQAVLNKEIMCLGNATDEEVFGYQERYADLRYMRSAITGKMRSAYNGDPFQSLDTWHLAQQFSDASNNRQRPNLNADFISERPPIKRVIAVQDEPEFIGDFYFKYSSVRCLPTYSIPSLIPRI